MCVREKVYNLLCGGEDMSLDYNKNMIPRAKAMRRPMTKHEALLWYRFLRHYSPRFQRQKTIGSYIADFYCHEGFFHYDLSDLYFWIANRYVMMNDLNKAFENYELGFKHAKAYDEERTRFLEAAGLYVLRFPNAMIEHDFAAVCTAIEHVVRIRS